MGRTVLATSRSASARPRPVSRPATVFLSYSRADEAFANDLQTRLEATGRVKVLIDTNEILPAEQWWARLESLIRGADAVVFVLSPRSAGSTVCHDEVSFAERLNKRIIPVVLERVGDRQAPPALHARNYVFFDTQEARQSSLWPLVLAVETDISWIRNHTRYGELAHHWLASGRRRDLLLRGRELAEAERWRSRQLPSTLPPTSLHHEFIELSRRSTSRLQRGIVLVSLALVAGTSTLAVWALLQKDAANQQRDAAQANALLARDNALVAQRNEALATQNEQRARAKEASVLCQLSVSESEQHSTTRAIELAVQAYDLQAPSAAMEIEHALYRAIWDHHEQRRTRVDAGSELVWFDRKRDDALMVATPQATARYDTTLDWVDTKPRDPEEDDRGFDRPKPRPRPSPTLGTKARGLFSALSGGAERPVETCSVHRDIFSIEDPKGKVVAYRESFDGTYFQRTSSPCTVFEIATFEGAPDWNPFASIDISPADELLAYSGAGNLTGINWAQPVIIDTNNGSPTLTLGGHATKTIGIDFSSDGQSLATLQADGTLRTWSLPRVVAADLVTQNDGCIIEEDCGKAHPPRLKQGNADFEDIVFRAAGDDRLRKAHETRISAAIELVPSRDIISADRSGKVLRWSNDRASPEVVHAGLGTAVVMLAPAVGAVPDGIYAATARRLYYLVPGRDAQEVATFPSLYLDGDLEGRYLPSMTMSMVPGFGPGEDLMTIQASESVGKGLVLDLANGEVLWNDHCSIQPTVTAAVGSIHCDWASESGSPRIGYYGRQRGTFDPVLAAGRELGGRSIANAKVSPIRGCKRGVVTTNGGNDDIHYAGDSALVDFETGTIVVRSSELPELHDDLDGLPAFCSLDDLVGYSRALHERVTRRGRPAPSMVCRADDLDWRNIDFCTGEGIGCQQLDEGSWESNVLEDQIGATAVLTSVTRVDLGEDDSPEFLVALSLSAFGSVDGEFVNYGMGGTCWQEVLAFAVDEGCQIRKIGGTGELHIMDASDGTCDAEDLVEIEVDGRMAIIDGVRWTLEHGSLQRDKR